jgi:hypothetical protein
VRCDQIGEQRRQNKGDDDDKARDRAAVGGEMRPEFRKRMRRRSGMRRSRRCFDGIGGHRVCRMRGLISP